MYFGFIILRDVGKYGEGYCFRFYVFFGYSVEVLS